MELVEVLSPKTMPNQSRHTLGYSLTIRTSRYEATYRG